MKKRLIFSCIILCAGMAISCQKDEIKGNSGQIAGETVTRSLHIEGNEWVPESKSYYEPGTGVVFTGEEPLAVYFANPANRGNASAATPYLQAVNTVTNNGNGNFTISHTAITGVDSYDYHFFVPSLATVQISTNTKTLTAKLSPVQTPGDNTFDPNYDLLIGKSQLDAGKADALTVTEFKRVTTPLRLSVSDGAGALGSEKISAVTVSFDTPATANCSLIGAYYVALSDTYEAGGITGGSARGNAVTAVYADGLAKTGDTYPVWFSVNPAGFETGTQMTVTVTAQTKTLSRTVTLNETDIRTGILNEMGFNISGEGYTETESVYQDFTGIGSITSTLTASDGSSRDWTFTSCSYATDEYLPAAVRMNTTSGSSITLPAFIGKQISKIRVYTSPRTGNACSLSLNGGADVDFGYTASLPASGGVAEITVPESEYGKDLILTATSGTFIGFNGMAFEFDENYEIPFDANDYYDMYTKGQDIEIGGTIYNINSSNMTARTVGTSELTADEFNKNAVTDGILFIDDSDQTEPVELSGVNTQPGKTVIAIGRYKDSQPRIRITNQYQLQGKTTVFKNLELIAGNATALVCNNKNYDDNNITIEDCTVDLTSSRYLCYAVAATASFGEIVINNSIIDVTGIINQPSLFVYGSSATSYQTSFTLTNSVVYSENLIAGYIIDMGADNEKFAGSANSINISGNTFYNIYNNSGICRGYDFATFNVEDNIAFIGEMPAKRPQFANVYSTASTSLLSGNYLYSNQTDDGSWGGLVRSGSVSLNDAGDNMVNGESSPFSSTNPAAGYFPADRTVTAAGADYSAKLWFTAE